MDYKTLVSRVSGLTALIFDPELTRIRRDLEMLLIDNGRLGMSNVGFKYQGRIITNLSLANQRTYKDQFTDIHPDLERRADEHVAERDALEFDRKRVGQALIMILGDCESEQDIRDALPNGLADLLEAYRTMPRTRPEAWTLANNPDKYNRYMKLREKMDYYIGLRLLY